MVPESATVRVSGESEALVADFEEYCSKNGLNLRINQEDDQVELTLYGVSAHGMEPHIGVNAGTTLASFLNQFKLSTNASTFIAFLTDLHKDYDGENLKIQFQDHITGTVSESRESQTHHVGADHPMIAALQKAYEKETGLEPTLLSIGAATYARFMENGVAFGACFPGKEMTAHQKDEYIEIEDLLKATAIFARAIYELAK
jgi:succinyl-diaminopimelate desuccinylase